MNNEWMGDGRWNAFLAWLLQTNETPIITVAHWRLLLAPHSRTEIYVINCYIYVIMNTFWDTIFDDFWFFSKFWRGIETGKLETSVKHHLPVLIHCHHIQTQSERPLQLPTPISTRWLHSHVLAHLSCQVVRDGNKKTVPKLSFAMINSFQVSLLKIEFKSAKTKKTCT